MGGGSLHHGIGVSRGVSTAGAGGCVSLRMRTDYGRYLMCIATLAGSDAASRSWALANVYRYASVLITGGRKWYLYLELIARRAKEDHGTPPHATHSEEGHLRLLLILLAAVPTTC